MNYLLANINVSSIKKVPLETKKLLETYAISYVFLVPEKRMFLQHSPFTKGDFIYVEQTFLSVYNSCCIQNIKGQWNDFDPTQLREFLYLSDLKLDIFV